MSKPPSSSSLPARVADLGVLINRRWSAVLAIYDITLAEYRLLSVVVERGSCTAVEIAAVVPIDPSFISRTIQRLATKQLLGRRRSRIDRRIVTLRPTEEGRALVRRLEEPVQDMERGLVQGISVSRLRQAGSVISTILANLESTGDPA